MKAEEKLIKALQSEFEINHRAGGSPVSDDYLASFVRKEGAKLLADAARWRFLLEGNYNSALVAKHLVADFNSGAFNKSVEFLMDQCRYDVPPQSSS